MHGHVQETLHLKGNLGFSIPNTDRETIFVLGMRKDAFCLLFWYISNISFTKCWCYWHNGSICISSWILPTFFFVLLFEFFNWQNIPYEHKQQDLLLTKKKKRKKTLKRRIKENALQLQTYYEAYVNPYTRDAMLHRA